MTLKIHGKLQLQFCPICGEKTKRETHYVGKYKQNTKVVCPKHGELFL